jgi:hypothetical protein
MPAPLAATSQCTAGIRSATSNARAAPTRAAGAQLAQAMRAPRRGARHVPESLDFQARAHPLASDVAREPRKKGVSAAQPAKKCLPCAPHVLCCAPIRAAQRCALANTD